MLRFKDIHIAKKQKKKVGWLFWEDTPLGYFRKNHSLTCGCRICKWDAYLKHQETKRRRKKAKKETDKLKGSNYYTEFDNEYYNKEDNKKIKKLQLFKSY